MSNLQIAIYVVFLCGEIFGISLFVEWYKKTLRKDSAKRWEIVTVGAILSIVSVLLLVGINIFQPVLGLIGAPLWVDLILYSIIVYVLQKQSDMKIVKKIVDSFTPTILKKLGLSDAQIKELLTEIKK